MSIMSAKRRASANPWPARLRALRERITLRQGHRFTQADAAAMFRVSTRAYVGWEHGTQIPTPSHQLLIDLIDKQEK